MASVPSAPIPTNSYSSVPQVLLDLPHWIVWRLEKRDGKETKVPYDSKNGAFAKSNDPKTWGTFQQAFETANNTLNNYNGCGFMLHGTDLVGIDFDSVLYKGQAEEFVLDILEKLGDPYCEITPSGVGLRTFVQCPSLPPGQRKFSDGKKYGCEIYSGAEGGRYLTVTFNQFSGKGVPKLPNLELAYFMISQIHNNKFKKLWMGDISEFGADQSRADLALLDILATLLNKDPQKVEQAFNASKLGQREKWTQRKDYRDRTIAKACAVPAPKSEALALPPDEAVMRLASIIVPKKIQWLWPDRIPLGKISLFAGNPDNGKSLAANSLAAICTTGRPFPDSPNRLPPSEVLMLLGEDDIEDTAVPRLMAAHADLNRVHFLESVIRSNSKSDPEVRLDFDIPAIERQLDKHPNIRLIIIDPISNYLGDVSMVAEQEARSILIPLKRMSCRKNVSSLIVMHLNKKNELDAISRVGGAMAFIGVARCSWMFIRDTTTEDGGITDSFSMVRIKNNLVKASGSGLAYHIEAVKIPIPGEIEPVWAPYVVWGDMIDKTADDVLEAKRRGPGRQEGVAPKMQDAMNWLEQVLQSGPMAAKTVIKQAKEEKNIKEDTLRRAQESLGIKPFQKAREWLWELPTMNAVGGEL